MDNSDSEFRLCTSGIEAHPISGTDRVRYESSGAGDGSSLARYKLISPARLPISTSPCIAIRPGLSPTSFLKSPVLLSNMKCSITANGDENTGEKMTMMAAAEVAWWVSTTVSGGEMRWGSMLIFGQLTLVSSQLQMAPIAILLMKEKLNGFEFKPRTRSDASGLPTATNYQLDVISKELKLPASVHGFASSATTPAGVNSDELKKGVPLNTGVQASKSDHNETGPPFVAERSSNDGYNWRKYGQKLVKGSEFPRSYYKCTNSNCEAKKIFKRSHDGKITEIVYKGTHDHPKPRPAHRDHLTILGYFALILTGWKLQYSYACVGDKQLGLFWGVKVKRRIAYKMLPDSRIWRRGWSRSYYKCANAGCAVRKHVERASHDPKAVITTYEGKHSHDVPAAKSRSHDMAACANLNCMSKVRSEESNCISLDLGFGICSVPSVFTPIKEYMIFQSASTYPSKHRRKTMKVLQVNNSIEMVERFEKYRETVKKRAREIIQSGFNTAYLKNNGIRLSTSSEELSENFINIAEVKNLKRAVIVCWTIAGTVGNVGDERSREDYDSVKIKGLFSKSEYLIVQNPSTVLPSFVVVLD
ncbi:WRKY family transcription factor family protein [Actinidia rufa]|uniref:WRKY family transcription factor family protein n=1 Tax=Actinidia rufa TaxID=165716 RepID=A0A7J0G9F2_9ERIC|nr:WRKY family transcription factor family protein [Actinidia rufa]